MMVPEKYLEFRRKQHLRSSVFDLGQHMVREFVEGQMRVLRLVHLCCAGITNVVHALMTERPLTHACRVFHHHHLAVLASQRRLLIELALARELRVVADLARDILWNAWA